jgi:hypothetical protein
MGEARERTNTVALEAQKLLAPLAGRLSAHSVARDSVTALSDLVGSVANRAG